MSTTIPGQRVTRLVKLIADVLWWVTLVGTVVGGLLFLFWPVLAREGLETTTRIPVSISEEAAARLLPGVAPGAAGEAGEATLEPEALEDLEGSLELRVNRWWPFLLEGLVAAAGVAAVLFGLYLLRSLLRDVLAGEVFTAANARRLSRLGWLLVIAGVAWPLLRFAHALVLFAVADLSEVPVGVGVDGFPWVLPGLFVLVVAAVWRYGVELQRDHDLTV